MDKRDNIINDDIRKEAHTQPICFTAHVYFKPVLLMVPYAFRILQQYYIEFH